MTGLVLGGGGVRGSYQVGVYLALRKSHIKLDGFTGSSIGAFNAAMLASNRSRELLKFWQTTEIGKIFGFSDEFIKVGDFIISQTLLFFILPVYFLINSKFP